MAAENLGARMVEEVTVDITSLDSAGAEPLSTFTGVSSIDVPDNYFVVGAADPAYAFSVDRTNDQLRVVEAGPVMNQKSVDPDSQEYADGTETQIAEFDAGPAGTLDPLNLNPADPTDANLEIVLRAEFHDGTTTDLVSEASGTEQTRENLLDGFGTGDDGKTVRKLLVIVNNTGGTDPTEDIGATTLEYYGYNADAPNNASVGEVTLRLEGRR